MITIALNDRDILQLKKIEEWDQLRFFTFIYSILVSALFSIILELHNSKEGQLIIAAIFVCGCILSVMFYYFARQSITISIDEVEILVEGSLVATRKRKFRIVNYSKIVLREYIDIRSIDWFCDLYVGRKYITLYNGDKGTGSSIAQSISEVLDIEFVTIRSYEVRKRQGHKIITWLMVSILILLPVLLIGFLINLIFMVVLLFLWIIFAVTAIIYATYHIFK